MKHCFVIFIILFTALLSADGEWHPEYNHWPRTILEAESLEIVRTRLEQEPYSAMYSRIISESELDYSIYENQRDKAEICRSAAFRYLMESDTLYADKAASYLLMAVREPSADYLEIYDNIIWDAETLTSICTAYDFLKGNQYQFEDEATIRANIRDIASGLYDDVTDHYLISIVWNAGGKKTNFGVKLGSALGLAAIVLNDEGSNNEYEQPTTWINYAMELLQTAYHDELVDEDGGWAEGQHYQKFVTFNLIPFVFSHHNFVDGATEDYGDLTLPPWLDDEQFIKNQEIGIALRMPDGTRPNFDDSFNNPHYINGIFAAYYENDVFAWDFINASDPYNTYVSPGYLDIEMICLYDNSFEGTTEPDYLTKFLPNAGQAVFRNSWDDDAVYMCLLGENGMARSGGRGHEHPDNGSFIIQAYGELLAMDSGYLNFDSHDSVRYAKNHSLILVDGEGPPAANTAAAGGTDAFIEDYFDLPDFDYAEVRTSYQDADFSRNVTYLYDKYFVFADIIHAEEEHDYQWLLHGNGGGDTGNMFQLLDNGAQYSVNNVNLTLSITADEIGNLNHYDDYHEVGYNTTGTHTVLSAETYGDTVTACAYLIPSLGDIEQTFTPLEMDNCSAGLLELDDFTSLILAKPDNETVSVDFLETPVITDAKMLLISSVGQALPDVIHLKEVSSFNFDNVEMIQTDVPVNVAINISPTQAAGYVNAGCELNLFCGNQPSAITGVDSYFYDSGLLTLTFSDAAYFDLEVEWSLVNTDATEDIPESCLSLKQNLPNPFKPYTIGDNNRSISGTTISFYLPDNDEVTLSIYNTRGQLIKTLLQAQSIQAGETSIYWNGCDSVGKAVSAGVYFYRIQTENELLARKMLVIK